MSYAPILPIVRLHLKKKKEKKKRCGNAWPNCSRSWLEPALLNVLFSHYQAQNYCEAKYMYSWKETFGEVICKLNPKSVESKININEIHFFFFCLPTYRLKLIRETRILNWSGPRAKGGGGCWKTT